MSTSGLLISLGRHVIHLLAYMPSYLSPGSSSPRGHVSQGWISFTNPHHHVFWAAGMM
ncbi:hypothetical protein BKA56DRAFT_565406 [Ilyonectria sp. MPI-CAGE-AT-0026]|nr:hypothetical protein BKA56DRAFT_565406 [Ilyonectria sp. MPI-CAGE-AT-0026]